jgi:cytosine/creatinine deaminase
MSSELLIQNVRPLGGAATDLLVRNGVIEQMEPGLTPPGGETQVLDGQGQLLLPGLVNAHAHIDKNLLGLPWHKNQVPGLRIRDFVDNERQVRRDLNLNTRLQSAHEVCAAVGAGVTHLRTHVDIDTDAGLSHLEGIMGTREEFKDAVTMQLVAFPQSGMLVRLGTVELLEEALKLGVECIGGIDPSTVDRDPVRHLDTVFGLADRYGVEVDIHLHEPGVLGAFSLELIAERTRVLGLQGRVTISHCYCLGSVEEEYLHQLIELLRENQITIMSLGSGRVQFPPLKRLHEAGVALCTGSDGVRDTWGSYNTVDMLERCRTLGYRLGVRKEEDFAFLLGIATFGGAKRMGDEHYGLAVGKQADFVVVPGDTPAEAIMELPPRTFVVKRGRLVAAAGECRL